MALDPRLLRSFVALADELHFGRAARRLSVAQPALSQQIRRLELQLGVTLFERTRSSVAITAAGAELLPLARAAVASAAAVEERARRLACGEDGELRLGISPGVHYIAQALLAEFAERRPGVRIMARQDSSGALARAVAAGDLELALAFAADGAAALHREELLREEAVLAVGDGHALAAREVVSLAELAGERFALVDARDGAGYNGAVVAMCREAGFEPATVADPRGPMAWETAVRSHGCVGLTTRSAAVATARGTALVRLRPAPSFPVQLLAPSAEALDARPAARAFAALARELAARPDARRLSAA